MPFFSSPSPRFPKRRSAALYTLGTVLAFTATAQGQTLCVDPSGGAGCVSEVTLGGRHVYDTVYVRNGGKITVTPYDGSDRENTGNLELVAPYIYIDATSVIDGDGAGYDSRRCADGAGPHEDSGGQGGCAVKDSGGGGAHFGDGGRGTKDMNNTTPALRDWEEDCGDSLNDAGTSCTDRTNCRNNDALPTVAGQSYFHSVWEVEFGASGGDKGCRDGDGFGSQPYVAGAGGGRIVLAGITDQADGEVIVEGTVRAMGWRGCGTGNDSAGGGGGGSVLIVGDDVTIGANANVWAAGGTGGDTQNLNGNTRYDLYRGQSCPAKAQTGGTCDDCGGGGGGGIVAVMSRRTADISGTADLDVSGAIGGSCDRCAGEAGGGAGELQISYGYAGEVCDGWDNDFDGEVDEDLGQITCSIGSCNKVVDACEGGAQNYCIGYDDPQCLEPDPDTRPRFALIMDTSGSMLTTLAGDAYTFGDGSAEHPGIDIDSNGKSDDSRLYKAKNALGNVIAAYPEVDWSLARFAQDQAQNRSCQLAAWFECAGICCTYDDPTEQSTTGSPVCNIQGMDVYPNESTDACINYAGTCGSPGDGADILTRFGASLNEYLMWMNHKETNFVNDETAGTYCDFASGGDCELRGTGPTPLADSLLSVRRYLDEVVATDPYSACRTYNVILLTDGTETCEGDPAAAAGTLLGGTGDTVRIETVVIGFSVTAEEQGQLDDIAAAGSLDGGGTALVANDEESLATVLASIVEDSIIYELCNGLDDDCDDEIDEDFPELGQICDNGLAGDCFGTGVYICKDDGSGVECEIDTGTIIGSSEEVCDGRDNDCDGQIDENGCDVCIPTGDEVCDGKDNDCDGETDEDIPSVPCGLDVGECSLGMTSCVDGEIECDGTLPQDEACNNLDDDCDGVIDGMYSACYPDGTEGCIISDGVATCEGECRASLAKCVAGEWGDCEGTVTPRAETCNGRDDDCDGETDEDISATDDPRLGEECGKGACLGITACEGGLIVCSGGAAPKDEVCNNLDDDCDGAVDEGLTQNCFDPPAYEETGICHFGWQLCKDGKWGVWDEDTFVEDGCQGQVRPQTEVCNDLDDDCDGEVDEEDGMPLIGRECSSSVGICEAGTLRCAIGDDGVAQIQCCASVDGDRNCIAPQGPTTEVCNGLDDDCNSLVDENITRPCGGCVKADYPQFECTDDPDEGECRQGGSHCAAELGSGVEAWGDCQGDIGPIAELCNLKDDDCDGEIDEDVVFDPAACSRSNTDNPNEGICEPGQFVCEDGVVDCQGGQEPIFETCNGLDDDCDGDVDEELPEVGQPCGKDVGICQAGAIQCICEEDLGCSLECIGVTEGVPEECNGLDDDCDGLVDEDLPLGATCTNSPTGSPLGECNEGNLQCIDGKWECNATAPSPEKCNGLDDDCDGEIDENLGVECPGESHCVQGECADPCLGPEQGCPPGKTCANITPEGSNESISVCVSDVCSKGSDNALPCVDNPNWCDDGESPPCKCSPTEQKCVNICRGVSCPEGRVCVPTTGACQPVSGDCYTAGCPTGKRCVQGVCEDDPCADITCEEDQYCNSEGKCVEACVNLDCPEGCREGECVEDRCAGVVCDAGLSCVPATGACEKGACWGITCQFWQVCEDGKCVEDPCWNVDCPNGHYCEDGACYFESPNHNGPVDTDEDTNGDTTKGGGDTDENTASTNTSDTDAQGAKDDRVSKVLATGTGGCLCATTVGRQAPSGWSFFALAGLVGAVVVLRRRRARKSIFVTGAGLLTSIFLLSSCQLEPYDFDRDSSKSQPAGTSNATDDTQGTAEGTDIENTDKETSTDNTDVATSTDCDTSRPDDDCDSVDDDCDGEVDEDVDTTSSLRHCGACGNNCSQKFPNAFGKCEQGACALDECASFFQDLNGSPEDGCEYYCQPTVDRDENRDGCDEIDLGDPQNPYKGVDNDCDGEVDEDVNLQTDPLNCGRCGNVCRYPNAEAVCQDGACHLGTCSDDYYDRDGQEQTGCESKCIPSGEEVCNGKDDDCDWHIDEAEGGGAYGAEGGAPCFTGKTGCTGDPLACEGACATGIWTCEAGQLRCKGQIKPSPQELCNDIDDDCDGEIDEEEDIELVGEDGALCGTSQGECEQGRTRCAKETADGPNALLCCAEVTDDGVCVPPVKPEELETTCDGLDNDCDGKIDESAAGKITGDACYYGQVWGEEPEFSNGRCAEGGGTWTCYFGLWFCEGAAGPIQEACNGVDDNCNGQIDEGLFDACRTQDYEVTGICAMGLKHCVNGEWGPCEGEIVPAEEQCDGLDNDCDGAVDEDIVFSDTTCSMSNTDNPDEGACDAGVWICENGQAVCSGTPPSPEECNGVDDDCDGEIDENFDTDVSLDHCGECNHSCVLTNAVTLCDHGTCEVLACETGFVDLDPEVEGCEYECSPTGSEICDGRDNDCDGLTDTEDPDMYVPDNFCRQLGECEGSQPVCMEIGGVTNWYCDYPVTVELKNPLAPNDIAVQETLCDDLDNDCDGVADESFPLKGQICSEVTDPEHPYGACLSSGHYACSESEPTSVSCEIETPGQAPSSEECNGIDDDCDGEVDEGDVDDLVEVDHSGQHFFIYKYEASRVDAAVAAGGTSQARSCSKPGVIPWYGPTFAQAEQACLAAGARLCTAEEWAAACAGELGNLYPYGPTYETETCNGLDYTPGDAAIVPAGSRTGCLSSDGVFDMSGNLREWTRDPDDDSSDIHVVRGGSFNSPMLGLTCDFTMSRATDTSVLRAIGFRCCHD